MSATAELPEDPALPALAAIRARGLAAVLPALGAVEAPQLIGRTPGSRCTLLARADDRGVVIKAYAKDPAPIAALLERLAAVGLADGHGPTVPPLLACDRTLQVVAIGWLDGPTLPQLVARGVGARAGELAARWLAHTAALRLDLGPPYGAARLLRRTRGWAAELDAVDRGLGASAGALSAALERAQPRDGEPCLVHGTLYARHVLDLGDGPGVIDWDRFGQGPLELDAGMLLATLSQLALNEALAAQAARAAESFSERVSGLVDERVLAWHRGAALLRLATHTVNHRRGDWRARATMLLGEAAQLVARR